MKNSLGALTRKEILDYAWKIERVDIDTMIVTYNREEVSLDVKYQRRAKGFVVCLDVSVVGPHAFWVQGNVEATDQDKIFWSELQDKEFNMRQDDSEEHAKMCREATDVLAQGFPD